MTSILFSALTFVFVHPSSTMRLRLFLNLVFRSHPALRSSSRYISDRSILNSAPAFFWIRLNFRLISDRQLSNTGFTASLILSVVATALSAVSCAMAICRSRSLSASSFQPSVTAAPVTSEAPVIMLCSLFLLS